MTVEVMICSSLLRWLVLLLAAAMCAANPCFNCNGGQDEPADREAEQRTVDLYKAFLKMRILNALGLQAEPNVTAKQANRELPAPLLDRIQSETNQNAVPSPKRAHRRGHRHHQLPIPSGNSGDESYIFGEPLGRCHENKPSSCFHFALGHNHRMASSQLASAELWVYKLEYDDDAPNRIQTMAVSPASRHHSEPNHHHAHTTRVHSTQQVAIKRGWVQFEVTSLVRHWLVKPSRYTGISVYCRTCNGGSLQEAVAGNVESLQPFLVITSTPAAVEPVPEIRRSTRSVSYCSIRRININFNAINLSTVVYPVDLEVRYCFGQCQLSEFTARNNQEPSRHSNLMQYISTHMDNPSLQPCCAPTSFSSQSIIYLAPDGTHTKKLVPNLLPNSCGCL